MLLVMVALMLGSCHTKKTTTTYKPGTSRPVKIPDEWRTLDISLSAGDNKKLYREIKGWLGTPYQYAGNTKRGMDLYQRCAHTLREVPLRFKRQGDTERKDRV